MQGWSYRKTIQINNIGPTIYDYQILVNIETSSLISTGKMQSNGRDIRFTDSDDTTLLNYWIESGINTTSTYIWVKIPTIPTGTKTIYFNYGNPAATPVSSGIDTFILFDDFSTNTWFGDDTYLHVANNKVNFNSIMNGDVADAFKYKPFSKTSDLIVYFSARINAAAYRGGIGIGFGDGAGKFVRPVTPGQVPETAGIPNAAYTRLTQDAWHMACRNITSTLDCAGATVSASNTQYWYKCVYSGDTINLYTYLDNKRISQVTGTNPSPSTKTGAPTVGLNYILITNTSSNYNNYPGDGSFLTSLFITKYVQFPPSVSIGPEESAKVTFVSNPTGARIFLDTIDTGLTTPSTMDVTVATHTFELRKDCYESVAGDFMSQPGQTITIDRTLRKNTGDIYFNSTPQGADIYIDGNLQIIPTPAQLPCILEGDHSYIISRSGYQYYKGIVTVVASQTTGIAVALIPTQASGYGGLYADSNPQGADIYLDGNDTGVNTPNAIPSILAGIHTIKLRKLGYADYTTSITVEDNTTSTLFAILTPSLAVGSISFVSTPSGAEIFIDDVDQNVITPRTITDISVGIHSYALKLTNYNDFIGNIEVLENQTSTVTATLVPIEGCIYFNSSPVGAEIFIDNVDQNATTPNIICGLTLGTHTYRLELSGYQTITGSTDLVTGAGSTINPTLQSLQQLTFIDVYPSSISITKGNTQQFTTICKDQSDNIMVCPTLTWNSSDVTKGSIDSNGLFTALNEGTTVITASSDNIIGIAVVSVTLVTPPAGGISILGNINTAAYVLGASMILSVVLSKKLSPKS